MTRNPIDVIPQTERLGRPQRNDEFQKIIIVCLGATAVASIGHMFADLLNELNRRESGRNR